MSRKYVRLAEEQWAEACALYEAGASAVELAQQFGTTRNTMSQGLAKRGAVKGRIREQRAEEVREKVANDIFSDPESHAQRVREVRESHLAAAETIRTQTIKAVRFDPASLAAVTMAKATLSAYDMAAKTLDRLYGVEARLLGIRNDEAEEPLTELVIRNITTEEIKEYQEREWGKSDWEERMVESGDLA